VGAIYSGLARLAMGGLWHYYIRIGNKNRK
jgi:hypothetical protein